VNTLLERAVQVFFKLIIGILQKFGPGRFIVEQLSNAINESTSIIRHRGHRFEFVTPNRITYFRARSFSQKEPETLNWIDSFETGCVFWDVGANVGIYSLYAAKTRTARVFAFEPSVFNLELLSKNIYRNNLVDRITIVPVPLTDHVGDSEFSLSTTAWGGALSAFGENFGFDNSPINEVFKYCMVGMPVDAVVANLEVPAPDYLKIDVDGIEHLILKGAKLTLRSVRSVLVEVNHDFREQYEAVEKFMRAAGFALLEETRSALFDNNERFDNSFNQIWVRVND